LSTRQYRSTVRDLLSQFDLDGLLQSVELRLQSVPDDSLGDSFRRLDDRVSLEHVQGYFNVGVAAGDALVADPSAMETLVGACFDPETLDETCFADFVDRFVERVYRRPLGEDDLAEYLSLNDGERSPAEVVRAVVVVAFSSPRFINQVEIDGTIANDAGDLLQLSAYEIASRLSYTFWDTLPDAELWGAAHDGSLTTEAGFQAQLDRLISDSRARDTLFRFWDEWLRLERFTGFETARPAFQALAEGEFIGEPGHDHYQDMVAEVRELTELFTFERAGTVTDLLLSNVSVTQSADLARLYGVAPYSGAGEYPSLTDRAGLLQRAALLVSNLEQTNPFHRGALVRSKILCDPLPQPDPNSLPPGALDPPPLDTAQTTRERFQAKVEGNTLCQGCHASFSNIGYVLEGFDALGRVRTSERVFDEQTGEFLAELPIDTVAEVSIAADPVVVQGPADLNQRIAESGKVEACLSQKYFSYVSRRVDAGSSTDGCVVDALAQALADPALGLERGFRAIAEYPSFFQRKVGAQ
jgi:hypothetical protein